MKRPTFVRATLAGAVLLVLSGPALAAACRGQDLMQRFGRTHPAAVRTIEREGAAMPHGTGRLFRLTRAGVPPSWLFGTIHSADRRVAEPPAAVAATLRDARLVALELDRDPGAGDLFAGMNPAEIDRLLIAPPDGQVATLLTRADLGRLETAAKPYGLTPEMARAMRPSILATMMSIPACASRPEPGHPVLDGRLFRMAKDAGKPVVGLETIAEQLGSMADIPVPAQKALIVSTIRHLPESENMLETLTVLYGRGEIGRIVAWARSPRPVPTIDAPLPPVFYEALIDRRNVRMAERAAPLLAAGNAFVAVGAAHLPGETGLLRLLEKVGWGVERME